MEEISVFALSVVEFLTLPFWDYYVGVGDDKNFNWKEYGGYLKRYEEEIKKLKLDEKIGKINDLNKLDFLKPEDYLVALIIKNGHVGLFECWYMNYLINDKTYSRLASARFDAILAYKDNNSQCKHVSHKRIILDKDRFVVICETCRKLTDKN